MGPFNIAKGRFYNVRFDYSFPANSHPTGSRRPAPAAWCPQEKKKEKKKREASSLLIRPAQQIKPH